MLVFYLELISSKHNSQYHLHHPELELENSSTVLLVWTTLVAGVNATGWHFLGWAQVLIGWAGWTSHRLPRLLCLLFLVGGTASLVVYLVPASGATAAGLGVVVSIWLGILLLKADPEETQMSGINASQPDQA